MFCACFFICVICTSIACSLGSRVSVLWLGFMFLCFVFRASCLALLLMVLCLFLGFVFRVSFYGFKV